MTQSTCPDCARGPSARCVRCFASLFTRNGDDLPDLPGLVVDRFVGRGGFGEVYEACDPVHERVAVKVLRAGGGRADRDRFRREFDAVRRLQHPGVVTVYDFAEDADRVWFTMDYLDGGSLADEFDDRPPPAVTLGYVRELADALVHAHDRGVCHLDLKPSNVMLDAAGRVVVVDFGLAARVGHAAALQQDVRGYTPEYAAPEVRAGAGVGVNPIRADVYSFGAVLARGLTGSPAPAEFPRDVPPDLAAICRKCLDTDPDRRYAHMSDVLADIDAYRAGRPVSARPLGVAARAWRRVKRHPGWSSLVAVALALSGVAGYQMWLRSTEQAQAEQARRTQEAVDAARLAAAEAAGLADAADAAFRVGKWETAAARYTDAVRRDHPDRDRLRVRRLQALFAAGRVADFQAELAATDAPALRGQLMLLQAELAFLDPVKSAEGRELVRQALVAPGLSEVDTAYARGLVAESSPEMLARFEEAATRDPTHYRSQAALATGLLVTGRYADARTRTRYVRGLFPDDLLPDFVEGFADLLDDSVGGGLPQLDRVADRLGGDRREQLRAHARLLSKLLGEIRKTNAEAGMGAGLMFTEKGVTDRAAFAAGLARMYSPDGFPLGVPSPVVSRLFEPGGAYIQAAQLFLSGEPRKAADLAEAALARDPDASLAAFASGVRFVLSNRLYQSKKPADREKLIDALRHVVDLGHLATTCPSRYPGSSFRYEGRAYAVVALSCLAREDEFPTVARDYWPKLLAEFPKVVAEGAQFPQMRRDVVKGLIDSGILSPHDSRALLSMLTAAGPEPAAWEFLVQVELRAGNVAAARDAADRGRAAFPKDAEFHARLDALLAKPPIPAAKP